MSAEELVRDGGSDLTKPSERFHFRIRTGEHLSLQMLRLVLALTVVTVQRHSLVKYSDGLLILSGFER